MGNHQLYWTITSINERTFLLAATNKGLCYIDCHDEPFPLFKKWATKHIPNYSLVENAHKLDKYVNKLNEYFSGRLTTCSIPLSLHGTDFQTTIWETLQSIPYGQTVSYSQIAQKINRPKAVRAVAAAIGANPILIFIPCHRVIGKDGSLTGFRSGIDMKKQLLTLENITL